MLCLIPSIRRTVRRHSELPGMATPYPAAVDFEMRNLRGAGNSWVAEISIRYDGGPWRPGVSHLPRLCALGSRAIRRRHSVRAKESAHRRIGVIVELVGVGSVVEPAEHRAVDWNPQKQSDEVVGRQE